MVSKYGFCSWIFARRSGNDCITGAFSPADETKAKAYQVSRDTVLDPKTKQKPEKDEHTALVVAFASDAGGRVGLPGVIKAPYYHG